MKKIVALGAAAALVGGLFAAEPASNPSVVEFTGKASVEWGVDLDAGKTGFKNDESASFKMKLFDTGTKETSADDDIWAELKIKIEDDDSVGPNGVNNGTPKWKAAAVDAAKFHFGKFFVGIRSGDTQTGELDFTTAVKSGDPWFHPGRWLSNVGPADYSQGIEAGYDDSNLNVTVDFRSLGTKGQYSDSYAIAAEAKLKDSNEFVEGLEVKAGGSYQLSDEYYENSNSNTAVTQKDKLGRKIGYSASAAYKFKIDDKYYVKPMVGFTGETYAINYKNFKYGDAPIPYDEINGTEFNGKLVASALFGWGDTNSYGSTGGLYYFDDDNVRGLTPGLSVLAMIPLPSVTQGSGKINGESGSFKDTTHDALKALIIPSVYLGDLVSNLKFAAYSEIGLYNGEIDSKDNDDAKNSVTESWGCAYDKDQTMALAVAAGVAYDIKSNDITITPKASFRYANTAYVENNTSALTPASDKTLFPTGADGLGVQDSVRDPESSRYKNTKDNKAYAGDFFNLKVGADLAGLINNTTFYAYWQSANLLNSTDYESDTVKAGSVDVPNTNKVDRGMYNVKLGRFTVGTKISF